MNGLINANKITQEDKWMVTVDGEFTNSIKKYLLNDGIPEDGVDSIISNAAKTIGYCPNPRGNKERQITGLMIGKVQSGKTSNFILATALAFDNGYNIAVVLGGTKNALLKQNKERIEEYFSERRNDIFVLSVVEQSDLLVETKIKSFLDAGKKIIIVSLKNAQRINSLCENLFNDEFIKRQPLLIVDDEGDEFSLNSKVLKNKESPVYSAVKRLRSMCMKCAFLSVTATPQANMIISKMDELSAEFAVLVYPGNGYCGLDVFHDSPSKYCVPIPDDERSILENSGIPKSFYDALSMFFVGAAIFHKRNNNNSKFSMLIHPSVKVKDISGVYSKVEGIVNEWKRIAKMNNDISFENLKKRFEFAFDKYKASGVSVKSFDEIVDDILDQLGTCGIHKIVGGKPLNDNDKYYSNNIYCGGTMVGRGLTFSGLAITYIIRDSKGKSNIDTVQQRARWFGYKQDYLDLCRVFATKNIITNFEVIKEHEEELWQTIEENNLIGKSFKEMKRVLLVGENLNLTRKSIARTVSYQLKTWTLSKKFAMSQEQQTYNVNLINGLIESYSNQLVFDVYGETKVRSIRGVSFDKIVDEYISKFMFCDDDLLTSELFKKIRNVLKNRKIETECDIVWPRYDRSSNIYVNDNGVISNYMAGRRPSGAEEGDLIYKGDRYINRGNVIEIQFHNIFNEKNHRESLTVALYIPANYREQLSFVAPEED